MYNIFRNFAMNFNCASVLIKEYKLLLRYDKD